MPGGWSACHMFMVHFHFPSRTEFTRGGGDGKWRRNVSDIRPLAHKLRGGLQILKGDRPPGESFLVGDFQSQGGIPQPAPLARALVINLIGHCSKIYD